MKKLLTIALLAGCIGLLQVHSIQFWNANVDATTGAACSILLEGAALMLWSSARWPRRALGAVATVLLLAGPLYQVSAPLVHEWHANERGGVANAERRAALEAEIASLDAALSTYLANSSQRVGWAERIDRTQASLDARRAELRTLIADQAAPKRMTWQAQAVIAMQALALMLLQFVGVLCIGDLRRAAAESAHVGAASGRDMPAPIPAPASGQRRHPSLAIVRHLRPRGAMA